MNKRKEDADRACRLRLDGKSVGEIASIVHASKGSVSLWVRDVILTKEQKEKLNKGRTNHQDVALAALKKKHSCRRAEMRRFGANEARDGNVLHAAGCMLYWGEGSKERNVVKVTNTDDELLAFFVRFLTQRMGVAKRDLAVSINCYANNGKTKEEIEDFWIKKLGLGKSSLRHTCVNKDKRGSSGRKTGKRPYGICSVWLCSTDMAQRIAGAIAEYAGIEKVGWAE